MPQRLQRMLQILLKKFRMQEIWMIRWQMQEEPLIGKNSGNVHLIRKLQNKSVQIVNRILKKAAPCAENSVQSEV